MTQPNAKFLTVRPEWLALADEAVLEPDLPIVDAHHHLWERPGWRYLLDDFSQDLATGHNVVATVYVQCHAMYRTDGPACLRPLGETEFANGMAAMSASGLYGPAKICDGIVGYADMRWGDDLAMLLDQQVARAGTRFKGVRQITSWDPDAFIVNPEFESTEKMLLDPRFVQGLKELQSRGLRFDAWMYHTQIKDLIELARALPELRIVLNHAGTPLGLGSYARDRAGTLADWQRDMRELSRCENVFLKLGGLGMRSAGLRMAENEKPLDSRQVADLMRPILEPCIEMFGPSRCMFESNFPVDKASYTYKTCWNAFKRVAAGSSTADKQALFSRTAARFYDLELTC